MKKLLIVALLIFSVLIVADETSSNWGQRILFGTTFLRDRAGTGTTLTELDSLRLRTSDLSNTVMAATLYSDALEIKESSEGIWSVKAWFDALSDGCDSLRLDVRLGTRFYNTNTTPPTMTVKFTPWRHLLSTMKHDTTYALGIAQSDSSWWQPFNLRQYRLYDTSVSVDTSLHFITDHLR